MCLARLVTYEILSFPTCSSKSFLCKDHPELRGCKEGDKRPSNENNHNRDIIIIKNIIHKHTGSGGSSSSSSSSISKDCYDAFRIVWLGNIHKGENKEIDTFMDKCFGLV